MATITEDYCSFETAKLLKEKGFHEVCKCQYGRHGDISWTSCNNGNVTTFARPTLQMAMKWLREVYNIHITINYSAFLYGTRPYYWNIDKMDTLPRANTQIETSTNTHDYSFVHYEIACETAIKYCLENLI